MRSPHWILHRFLEGRVRDLQIVLVGDGRRVDADLLVTVRSNIMDLRQIFRIDGTHEHRRCVFPDFHLRVKLVTADRKQIHPIVIRRLFEERHARVHPAPTDRIGILLEE